MRTPGRPFTPQEDAVIVEMAPNHSLVEIGRVLERTESSSLYRRVQKLTQDGRITERYMHARPWTPELDEELIYLTRKYPIEVVARRIRRTKEGCTSRLQRILGPGGSRDFRGDTEGQKGILGSEFCRIFGVTTKLMIYWMRHGYVVPVGRAGYTKGKYSPCFFDPEEIRRFIREFSDRYYVEDMQVGPYRRLAEQVRRDEAADPRLSPKQVAAMKDVRVSTVRKNVSCGILKGRVRPGTSSQIEIRKSVADAWTPDYAKSHRQTVRKAA